MKQDKPTLIVFCGLPGSGKTTIARQVEERTGAIRLNTDEWMADLKLDYFDEAQRNLLQARLIKHGEHLIGQGLSVILEDGQWSKAERDEKVVTAKRLETKISIHVFDLSFDELWRRIEHRNSNLTHGAVPITKELLQSYVKLFQSPTEEELRSYDEVHTYDDESSLELT